MLKNLFTLLIVLYPILSAYIIWGPIDLGVALCGFVAGLMFVKGKYRKIIFPKGWLAFLFYIALTSILITQTLPARIILYSFLLFMGCNYCDPKLLSKLYFKVAAICILFFFIQELARFTMGVSIPGIFDFLPTIYGDSNLYVDNLFDSTRSASFFLEPSYFAQFIFPLIVLELFGNKHKNHIRRALILTLVTFLIRSGNGIVLLIIIWSMWFLFGNVKNHTKQKMLVIGCFAVAIALTYSSEYFLDIINRYSELTLSQNNGEWLSSGFIRFWRGYFLYDSLPDLNKIFGINPSMLEFYMVNNRLGLFDHDKTFINGIQTVLCQYGIIGLFFFIRHLYLLGKDATITTKMLLLGSLYLLISESFFITGRMLLVIVLAFLIKQHKNENSVHNELIPTRE